MQTISTNTLTTRKKVEIDGHPYTVRKFGAGEQLRLNQLLREAQKLGKQLEGVTENDELEAKAIKVATDLMDMFIPLFDDGGDGSKSRKLLESLSQEEVQLLFNQIFDEPQSAETKSS